MKKRILLADDHGILRQGIAALIQQKCSDMEVVGEAEDGQTTVQLARELQPDIILMDVSMPGLNGIEATRQIKEQLPDIKILALSVHASREFVLDMLKAGASGYMLKECVLDDLIQAINVVIANECYLSPRIARIVVDNIARNDPTAGNSTPGITPSKLSHFC